MKKNTTLLLALFLSISLMAADFTGKKIYINPGHGGYDGANDRNIQTINYLLGDTLGFWESWSNLQKGLALRDMLQASGATVYMSRTQNRDQDDRVLSEIAEEANTNGVDAFLSIHSNAQGTNTGTNYILLLYHGYDNAPTVAASLPMATAAWPRLFSNKLSNWTAYTTSSNLRGDFSFYGGTSGLGVLRPLTVPGFLSEGSFHDYQPETHRLLNKDYRKLEAVNFYRYFCDYFQADLPSTGVIAGYVKGKNETIVNALYNYKQGTDDQWRPLNGANVKLMNNAGDSLAGYKIDTLYNGIFAFYNLSPGTYKLRFTEKNHTTKDTTVNVLAATTTYSKMLLVDPLLKDSTPNYPEPTINGAVALTNYTFGSSTPVVPTWLNPNLIKKVLYRNDKLYILTNEPKIITANATTGVQLSEISTTGISGGTETISDIAFTADGYLMACNKDTIALNETRNREFKVYVWDSEASTPKVYFQTAYQAGWSNAVVGGTMAISGSRWKATIYTTAIEAENAKSARIMGLIYEERPTILSYKYMIPSGNTSEANWGKGIKLIISPTAPDYLFIDSEKLLPTEFQFDWSATQGADLVYKNTFAETGGYQLPAVATGINFFRHAKHVFMTSPVCNADSTAVGVALFDVTNGINNALKVSQKLPDTGLGTSKATYMVATGKNSTYDIELLVLAQNQGMARYKTTATATKANIYASELNVETTATGYNLKFTLNENSASTTINFYNGQNVVKTIEAGALNKGVQTIAVANADLPEGTLSWSVKVATTSVDRPVKISDNNLIQMQFYSPRGVAVDNGFESPCFGRIYASETLPRTNTGRQTKDGLYILNAALDDVTAQGANSYAGGVTWGAASSPMRVAVGEDGLVYLTDMSDTNPGVWIMNPTSPTSNFTPVFSGLTLTAGLASKSGVNVHGAISHCWVTGSGSTRKLYTFDKYYIDAVATNPGNLLQYNIGTLSSSWQTAPSAIVYNDGINGNLQQNYNSCIAPDGRNGWWISQYRATDAATIPSLIHVKPDGSVSFNSGKNPLLIGNSVMGGMAVNYEGTKLAMGCQDEVKVFSITFSATGTPSLTLDHSIKPAMGTNTAGLSYDRAGNLYVISNTSERLGVWSLPKTDNSFTTPAPSAQKIVVSKTGISDLQLEKQILVYPSPASDRLSVSLPGGNIESVSVITISGSLVLSHEVQADKAELSLSSIPSGIYMLKVVTDRGCVVKRFIKK